MPLIFRIMLGDDGVPKTGAERDCLGVRVPIDVKPDAGGILHPRTRQGMSVSPRVEDFPPFLVPARLVRRFPGATNQNAALMIWRMGEGPFEEGILASRFPNLYLRPDKPGHGTVGLIQPTPLEEFQRALAATQDSWRSIEDEDE